MNPCLLTSDLLPYGGQQETNMLSPWGGISVSPLLPDFHILPTLWQCRRHVSNI